MGLNYFGSQVFRSPGSILKNISYIEIKNGIYDEFSIKDTANANVAPIKDEWDIGTKAIFQFISDLEGGNIQNSGLKIVSFQIRRRKTSELNGYTLATVDFVNGEEVEYTDYTQSNEEYIYSIVPLAENALDGKAMSVIAKSEFVGYWVVDKENQVSIPFDKAIGSVGDVDVQTNQGRTILETLSRYPSIYYSEKDYATFSLETILIPSEFERSGIMYEEFLDSVVRNHKPFLVKSSNGLVYACDISNPTIKTPQNTWTGYDYATIKIDLTEIGSYEEYMRSEI